MSTDQTEFELFISYARRDNGPAPHGWVTAVRDFLLSDHRRYSAAPLRIFFDTDEIRDMDDWRNRILGALRRSKVLLIGLSPHYFASLPCRWEWDEFLARQAHKLVGSEPHATVYFADVPDPDGPDATRLDAVMGKNFTDLRPWFPTGPVALTEDEVRGRMAALGQSVWERIDRARRALAVPGNLRAVTPYFLGRNRELAELHRLVGVGKIGLVAAVHGLGGQGKTELSVAYARGYADCYPLGLWSLDAEHKVELLPLLGNLAFVPEFGYTPTDAEKSDAVRLGKAVLSVLQRRAEAARAADPATAPAALILLDNVSEPGLLDATQLAKLPKVDWLRIIATTRLDPKPLDPAGKSVGTVQVDALDPDTALRLIRDHLPGERFRTAGDEAAAREIVTELGGFTLAVEQVAVFLAVTPDVSPVEYLQRLRAEGLHETDALVGAATGGQILHQEKLLGPILDSMLDPARVPPAARTLLAFASRLPPDAIPWPWLKELTVARHPECGTKKPGYPDPWLALRRQVEGLRFLTGTADGEFARMHRLVAAHLRRNVDAAMDTELRTFVGNQVRDYYLRTTRVAAWEMDAALASLPHLLARSADSRLVTLSAFFIDTVLTYRTLLTARQLLSAIKAALRTVSPGDLATTPWQRALANTLNATGDVAVNEGRLAHAKLLLAEALAVRRRLVAANPSDGDDAQNLSVTLDSLGNLAVEMGHLRDAEDFFRESLAIRRRFADADPADTTATRCLAVVLNHLGDLLIKTGRAGEAATAFAESLAIYRRLAADVPDNPTAQANVAPALERQGNLAMFQGRPAEAEGHYAECHSIQQRAVERDPSNTALRRDLAAARLKLGIAAFAQQKFAEADGHFADGEGIMRRLIASDPGNPAWRRDLWLAVDKRGEVAVADGRRADADGHFEDGLRLTRGLAESDPANVTWQSDLSAALDRMGDVAAAHGDWDAAERYAQEFHDVLARLTAKTSTLSSVNRDLAIALHKLGNAAQAQKRWADAARHHRAAVDRSLELVAAEPDNALWRRDVPTLRMSLANAIAKLGDSAGADEQFRLAGRELEGIQADGIHLSPQEADNLRRLRAKARAIDAAREVGGHGAWKKSK